MPYRLIAVVAAFGVAAAAPVATLAQDYPTKPIRMIIPFPPGGGNDVIGRIVGIELTKRLGQQVVAENRGGANGMLGLQLLTQAPADGYTIAVGAAGPLAINISLYEKIPYDPVKDFAPVTNMVNFPLLLVTHPSVPAKTVREFVALAKAKPDGVNYASPGSGNSGHLAGELFNDLAQVKLVHVPYKGAGPAIADLVAGQVQAMWSSIPSVLPFVQQGKLVALGVGNAQRLQSLPDVPTIAEAGVPKYEAYSWVGMVAPAKTPPAIVAKLNREIVAILQDRDVNAKLVAQGAIPVGDSPEAFGKYIQAEIAKWGAVVRSAKIKAD